MAQQKQIVDAGEKIGGARKDWATREMSVDDLAALTAEEAGLHVTKDNIWPQPKYQSLIEGGLDRKAAALMKIIRDRMAAKPDLTIYQWGTRTLRDSTKIYSDFVTMTGMVRDLMMQCKSPEDVKDVSSKISARLNLKDRFRDDETRHLLWSIYKGRKDPVHVSYADQSKADRMIAEGWPASQPAWQKGLRFGRNAEGVYAVKGGKVVASGFESQEAVLAHLKAQAEDKSKTTKKVPERPHLDRIQRDGMTDYRGGRDVSPEDFISEFGFRGVEFGNWLPNDERQRVLNHAFDAFHDLADLLGWPHDAVSLGGTLAVAFGARGQGNAAAHYEPGRRVVNVTRLSGAGSLAHEMGHAFDHWCGEVDQAEPGRGAVRSGSGWYTATKSREAFLKNMTSEEAAAWESVMQTIWRRPNTREEALVLVQKNLTLLSEKVAEATANRDKYVERYQEKDRDRNYLRKIQDWLDHASKVMIPGLEKKITAITEAPEGADFGTVRTNYVSEASALCGKSGEYWLRPTEMFARAFETTVFDRIIERGSRSDYLVHGCEADRYANRERYKGNPYPVGDERKAITAEIGKLTDAVAVRFEPTNEYGGPRP